MEQPFEVQPDVHVLPAYIPVPTMGLLPANAFLVKGLQPYLVDTGLIVDGPAFVSAVEALIDLDDLRWIYLTHTDPDHIGSLMALVDRAPQVKVVTTFIAIAKLQLLLRPLPPDRIRLCNPGESIDLGDRKLTVMRPPLFDAPETTMVHDSRLDALFSADTFGGPLQAPAVLANELTDETLAPSQQLWATVDSPWIHNIDRRRFRAQLQDVSELDPSWIFSAHLPPARRMAKALCRNLAKAPDAPRFKSPDQAAFQAIMQSLSAPSPAPAP